MSGAGDAARRRGVIGRRLLVVVLVVSAVLHAVVAVRFWPSVPAGLGALVAVAAAGTAFAVVADARPRVPLAAVVVGAAGVAVFLLPALLTLGAGDSAAPVLDGWAIAAFLVDTVVARLAAATLRGAARTRQA